MSSQPSFAKVRTKQGLEKISSLQEKDLVWTDCGWVEIKSIQSQGCKPVFSYLTRNGSKVISAPCQKVLSTHGKIEVGEAENLYFSLSCFSDIKSCIFLGNYEVFSIVFENPKQLYFSEGVLLCSGVV